MARHRHLHTTVATTSPSIVFDSRERALRAVPNIGKREGVRKNAWQNFLKTHRREGTMEALSIRWAGMSAQAQWERGVGISMNLALSED